MTPSPIEITDHVPLTHTPKFWNPEKAYQEYRPDLAGAYIEGVEYALAKGLRSAQALNKVGINNLIMLTDLQGDFRPGGRLAVKGTDHVVLRVGARVLNGIVEDFYTGVIFSLDGHPHQHISWSLRWRTTKGLPFDLRINKAAILNLVDRSKGIFRATCFNPNDGSPIDMGYVQSKFDPKATVDYWDHLQATGQGPIWVFDVHCALGSEGMALHPLISEVIAFASGARSIMPGTINKGHIVGTDWFGPLAPCQPDTKHPQGGLQKDVIDAFRKANQVDFAGVAEDFCEYWMERQTLENLAGTDVIQRLRFIEDGTAPIVPGAAHVAAHRAEAKRQGVKFINHDAPFTQAAA